MRRLSTLALIILLAAHTPALAGPPVSSGRPEVPPGLADRDRDGLSDGLQSKLESARPQDRFSVVVTFKGPNSSAAASAAAGRFNARRTFRIIPGFAASMTAAQIRGLARSAGVFRIEEDFEVSINLEAANRDFGTGAARTDLGVDGTGVGICVIDTGADPGHEQLDGGKIAGFQDYVNGLTTPYDDHGHGTHVTSIAAGDGTGGPEAAAFGGVAPGALVYAAKTLAASGFGDESDSIAAIDWCVMQPGVRIISMSLSSSIPSDGSDAFSLAVDAAFDAGFAVVVAAGNDGDAPGTIGSPGVANKAITIGAAAEWSAASGAAWHSNGVHVAAFSGRGPTLDARIKPDVVAPGVSIRAAEAGTASGYVIFSGTSMATPFTSGTLALALEAEPGLTPTHLRNMLAATAHDRGDPGKDNEWGAGLLDGYLVVSHAAADLTAPPTDFPAHFRVSGSVPDLGLWSHPFNLTAAQMGTPVSAMITLDGAAVCIIEIFGICLLEAWVPDLDARLIDPNSTELVFSGCADGSEDCGALGRQETASALPTVPGTYTLEVEPYVGPFSEGTGGTFVVDFSVGPAGDDSTSLPADTDSDGVPDLYETNTGIFLFAVDTGTDPAIADTDGDGVNDGAEVAAGTNPNVAEAGSGVPALSAPGIALFLSTLLLIGWGRRRSRPAPSARQRRVRH